MQIGFIGLGIMGTPMAGHLIKAGHTLHLRSKGPIPPDLWEQAKCALTVQSSVALECSQRGIPVFLCGWLADSAVGYVQQYVRFGIGEFLRTPQEIDRIPKRLESTETHPPQPANADQFLHPEVLRRMLTGTYSRAAVVNA